MEFFGQAIETLKRWSLHWELVLAFGGSSISSKAMVLITQVQMLICGKVTYKN